MTLPSSLMYERHGPGECAAAVAGGFADDGSVLAICMEKKSKHLRVQASCLQQRPSGAARGIMAGPKAIPCGEHGRCHRPLPAPHRPRRQDHLADGKVTTLPSMMITRLANMMTRAWSTRRRS